MPDDLLSGNSILAYTRETMTPDVCGDVEVIGWLYQFYISEKKDKVFDGLKKNKKITPENIPAATQLFTPHWIVRYLVETSLGRLWMLNRPNSRLIDRMEYYIRPDTSVGSEKWEVESKENQYGRAKLSGTNSLAEGDGYGRVGVSGNQGVSQGGALRSDQPGSQSGSVDSVEHSGGASTSIDSGVQKLSIHSARIESRSGNANHDSSAAGVSSATANRSDSQSIRGNQADDLFINSEAEITSHSPLPTSHSAATRQEDFLRIEKPEDIKICDPACGSGHMLTYAFDLLYAIYEEEGYEPAEIPEKILTNNLYGIEIDERAGELAAFALTMKARSKQRRFFNKGVKPNICVLENVRFDEGELKEVGSEKWVVGSEKQKALYHDLNLFEEADNFGSLLRPHLPLEDIESFQKTIHSTLSTSQSLFDSMTHQKVLQALRQADYLSPKYHVVIANPPYMGGKGMNGRLATWVKDNYPNSKSDLFAMFIERGLELVPKHGYSAMVTMQSWMFLSSFELLRAKLLAQTSIESMAHMANMVMGIAFGTSATIWRIGRRNTSVGAYCYVEYNDLGNDKIPKNFPPRNERNRKRESHGWLYRITSADFKKIPSIPIAYWVSSKFADSWSVKELVENITISDGQNKTGDNLKFLRFHWELDRNRFLNSVWIPYAKGGPWRKWYGNEELLIDWSDEARRHFRKDKIARLIPEYLWYKKGISWSFITTKDVGFRYLPEGGTFDVQGSTLFFKDESKLCNVLALLNSKPVNSLLRILNPTISLQVKDVRGVPIPDNFSFEKTDSLCNSAIHICKGDWDSYETSLDFTSLPLLQVVSGQWPVVSEEKSSRLQLTTGHYPLATKLSEAFAKLRAHWQEMTLEMQRLEEENNRIFIDAYGLQDELTPEVPLGEITLTCNPHYRYGVEECEVGSKKWEEMESRLLQDTMKELVSYAVGCMFGRYSLDMPGLVLANHGEGIEDYCRKIEEYRTNEREKLSRVDCLAGDGFGGADLSSDQKLSQGGTVRSDESDSQGGSVDSLKHSGGSGEAINGGVQKFSVDSTGFPSRSGNPTDDRSTPGLPPAGESGANPESVRGNQTHDLRPDSETVLTSHSPLPTSHLSFVPDEDNVIPMLDGDWFTDDIAERFRRFLRVAFGDEHYEANLKFVEKALNIKGKRNYTIRDYFLGEFYTDHVKRYKKRPIYWLFSSPKGSFNALIYMHRYRPDTVSVVLNGYLREFRTKLLSRKSHLEAVSISSSASPGEKTKALKEIESLGKMIEELESYERDVLYPLATQQLEIDLDDGVKVNYQKFGPALRKISGLDAKEE